MTRNKIAFGSLRKEIAELIGLAMKIREYQERKGYSDAQMCRRYQALGSTKTYQKCRDGEVHDLDIERQVANYRTVWALIEGMADEETKAEPIFDDLSTVLQLRRAFLETIRESGNARVILVQGDSGSGKTSAVMSLMEKYGQRLIYLEASDAWNDAPTAMLAALLRTLGYREAPRFTVEMLAKVVDALSASRRCLVIEEAHHLGPRLLNVVKTLVNQTPGEFILIALPTLWRRLEGRAYEEARQLTGNRLAERIRFDQISPGDVRKIVSRRCPQLDEECATLAVNLIVSKAPSVGNLAFCRDVCRRLAAQSADESLDRDDVAAAITEELRSR